MANTTFISETILILGNGFDIAMGRKTKYTDFIEFEKQLYSNPDKELQDFLNYKGIDIDKYKDNVYLKFINENKDTLGDNWSNLEKMISNIADAIMYFKENSDFLYHNRYNVPIQAFIDRIKPEWRNNNYSAKSFVADTFAALFDKKGWKSLERENALKELNNEFIKHLELLIELLEIYLSYIDYLDFEVRKIKPKPTALDAIPDLSYSYVLNFNYTNTPGYLFGTSERLTHFIHGRIDLDRTFSRINTMVFGIEDKEDDVNSDLIPYQKYYQRVVKETGNYYESFFNFDLEFLENDDFSNPDVDSKNFIIFGHSVDPLDKEIFQKCFELAALSKPPYRFIFTYFDEAAKRSIIKNLAIILGKETLVELTGQRKVVFVQSDDANGMKDAFLKWSLPGR